MSGETLLTGKLSEEQQQEYKQQQIDWDRFALLLELIQEGYLSGEIKFDRACVLAVEMSKDYEGIELKLLPSAGRHRMLGEFLDKMLSEKKPQTIKVVTVPESIKKIVAQLVKKANQDGYILTREDSDMSQSAFRHIADLMQKYGIELATSTVEKYYQKHK